MKLYLPKLLGLFVIFAAAALVFIIKDHYARWQEQVSPGTEASTALDPMSTIHGSPQLNDALREASLIKTSPDHAVPFHSDPMLNKAMTLIGQSEWLEAENILLALLEKNPQDPEVLKELVTVEVAGKMRPKQGVMYLERLIGIEPNFPGIWVRYQDTVALAEGQSSALKFLASLQNQDRFEIPYTMAVFLSETGDYQKAEYWFEKSLQYETDQTSNIYQKISEMQKKQGDFRGAEISVVKAIEAIESYNANLEPIQVKAKQDLLPALLAKVDVYMESGRRNEGLELLDELLEKDPTNPYLVNLSKKWRNMPPVDR
jgi:tetratricopeptide (TPR) repeat protein